jgi:circadian clock protein KaiC
LGSHRILSASVAAADGSILDRTTTGIPGLDPILEGGFPANRAIVVCGGTGTGKTTFGLQFLAEGLRAGENGAFISVDEKPRHLLQNAASLGLDVDRLGDRLTVLDAAPFFSATRSGSWTRSAVDAREVASDLVQQVRKVSARRLVIDTLTSLVPPDLTRGHAYDYLRSLIFSLEDNLGCTILLACRPSRHDPQGATESAKCLASGVIDLRLVRRGSELTRMLLVRKMRGRELDLTEHPVSLTRGYGVSVTARMDAPDVRGLFKAV